MLWRTKQKSAFPALHVARHPGGLHRHGLVLSGTVDKGQTRPAAHVDGDKRLTSMDWTEQDAFDHLSDKTLR